MNITYIKNEVFKEFNIKHTFIYKGNRNQIEKFDGFIEKCYSRVFLIKLFDGKIKSFSYSDVIIGNLELLPYSG